MIFAIPPVDSGERRAIDRIQHLKDTLSYAVGSTPRRWQGVLRRSTLARATRGSNSIEGYDISVDDAIAVGEGEKPLDASAETIAAVQGYQQAMTYVLQLAADPHFAYTSALVRSLHFMMIQHDLSKNPGRWRPGTIYVRDDSREQVVYEGPPSDTVPPLVEELMAQLNEPEAGAPPMLIAAMAHLNLVMIHPFSDGNGRMARCLQTLVLARCGTLAPQFSSIEEYLGANTPAYYNVLAAVGAGAWHPERDVRPWIRFTLIAHYRQATTMLRRARELERLWNELEREMRKAALPERIMLALADAANGWRVRNATYRPIAEVSEQVASNDLAAAVGAGFLSPKGERRGRFYIASERLLAIRAATREPRADDEDPFAEPTGQLSLRGLAGPPP